MKKPILLFCTLLLSSLIFAQAPQKMSYQTVIRNATDDLISNSTVGIQISVLQGSAVGTAVYVETHAPMTNANGLASLEIGGGAVVTGTMAAIDWGSGPYYVKSEVDPTGGTSYTLSVTSELLSVPYALHSGSSGTSQWSESGSGINTSNFTVGINSENPAHTLDVRSQSLADPAGLNVSNADRSRYVRLFSGSETFPDPSMSWSPEHSLLFATFDNNTLDFQEKMRISSAGNVGIGVTEPQVKLDIQGGDYDLEAGSQGDVRIGNETYHFKIGIDTTASQKGTTRLYTSGDTLQLGTRDKPRITILQNGTIGFNDVTEPKAQLHLNGSIRITNTILRGYPSSFVIQDQGQISKIGLYENFSEWGPNTNGVIKLGSSGHRYSEIWSVNALNTSSDRRLKKDIEPIEYGLSEVLNLKPVSYKWKEGNQDTKLGFIAQDVTSVVPEIVKLEETTPEIRKQIIESGRQVPEVDYYAMSYTELIPVLVKAIQELNAKNDALQKEVDLLKSKK